jgi:hypothetical protein
VYLQVSIKLSLVNHIQSLLGYLRGTNLIAQVWVYSSQTLTMFSGLPDLLFGHADDLGHKGAVVHLGVIAYLGGFIEC